MNIYKIKNLLNNLLFILILGFLVTNHIFLLIGISFDKMKFLILKPQSLYFLIVYFDDSLSDEDSIKSSIIFLNLISL